MRRKLPKRTGPEYPSMALPVGIWAYARVSYPDTIVQDVDPVLTHLIRMKTYEIPGSKWVEYRFSPAVRTIFGHEIYADPEFEFSSVRCEWSDFLRLTRWGKKIQHQPASSQALIASVRRTHNEHVDWQLVAVEHPIRHAVRGE
jgi:hypothetical protein